MNVICSQLQAVVSLYVYCLMPCSSAATVFPMI